MGITQLLYIDPAATSVLITSLTAVVVAIGASAIVIWRKFKKKVDKTLNKDPNANKEVEGDLVILDEEVKNAEAAAPAEENNGATAEEVPAEETKKTEKEEAPAEKPEQAKSDK
ncbi:MAG: hypothetical protein K2N47_00750 [Clostridia bacterium]|nr:hypothetical protein [Clostridia bacterium]